MKPRNLLQTGRAFLLFSLCLFQACTLNMIGGGATNSMRKGPETPIEVQFLYSPKTNLSIANDAEYFDDLRDDYDLALSYDGQFRGELASFNLLCGNSDSARFSISILEMSFSESTQGECKTSEDGIEFCCLLNSLSVSVEMLVKDNLTQKEEGFRSETNESSIIKKPLLGKGLTESTSGMSLGQLSGRVITKCAGKAAKYIRKNSTP